MTETMYLGNRHTLTDTELEDVLAAINNEGEVAGVLELWAAVLGVAVEDHEGTIDPTAYAIPAAQWKEICQAMMDNPQHDGMPGGTMMNSGPSSFDSASVRPLTYSEAINSPGFNKPTGSVST